MEVAVSGTERPRQVGRDRSHGHSFLTLRNNLLGIDPTVVGKKKGGISGYEYGTNYLAVGDNGAQAIWTISAGASGVSGTTPG